VTREVPGLEEMIMMMYWYGSGMSGWGYALMTVSLILFGGTVILGIVAVVRFLGHGAQSSAASPSPRSPEGLLAERFARGEISEKEYRQRLSVLRDADQRADSRSSVPAGTGGR
jgi:putative membrane protein